MTDRDPTLSTSPTAPETISGEEATSVIEAIEYLNFAHPALPRTLVKLRAMTNQKKGSDPIYAGSNLCEDGTYLSDQLNSSTSESVPNISAGVSEEEREITLTEYERDYARGVLQSHHKGLVELRMGIPTVLKSLLLKLKESPDV